MIFSNLLTAVKTIKLTIQQYALITLAAIIGILGIVLKIRTNQLQQARIKLLQAHFENQQQITDQKITDANKKFDDSLRRLNDAVSKFHSNPSN